MKKFLTQLALGAAALFCVGAANASYVMDFETGVGFSDTLDAPLLLDGQQVTQGAYYAAAFDVNSGGGLVGGLANGTNYGCLGTCPTNAQGTFLSVLNDGIAQFGALDNSSVLFQSLSAAYIPNAAAPANSTVYLVIEADRVDKTYASFYFPLATGGTFQTITSASTGTFLGGTGTLTSGNVLAYSVYGYFCNGSSGSCSRFTTDQAQFGLDNFTFATAAVPEPSELMLMVLGLGALGAAARRRRSI